VLADAEQIQAATERAAALTRQLLIFTEREVTQPEVLDLNVVIDEIRDLLSTSIGAHVDLRIDPAAHLPAIKADRGEVGQVLLNLAVNAGDAIPQSGTVRIGTSLSELDDDYARLHPGVSPGRYVELTVSDTGTGISAEMAARIFEPFFTTKPVGQGTGLGLSTVYAIVTQAGGSVTVESGEGTGTTFRLYFPAIDVTAGAPDAAPGDRPHLATILVVDDEPAVLEVTGRILRKNGFTTLEAGTYEQALSLASSRYFPASPHRLHHARHDRCHAGRANHRDETRNARPAHVGIFRRNTGPRKHPRRELAYIQKPLTAPALLEKVHAVLNTPQASDQTARPCWTPGRSPATPPRTGRRGRREHGMSGQPCEQCQAEQRPVPSYRHGRFLR